MQRNAKKGFTIVELVIVIAVIAILAAVLIPTFASLIEKANMSVDMQMVRQMNTILAADEAVAGKPSQAAEAKAILAENGITQFTPVKTGSTFYWVGADNKVILWEKDDGEDVETGEVTYPKDMAKKYASYTEPSADWADLSIDYEAVIIEVTPEGEQTLGEALIEAVFDAEDGAILELPENSVVDMQKGGLGWLGLAMKKDGGTGKHITIDLNGSTLTSTGTDAEWMLNAEGTDWYLNPNGKRAKNILKIPANGELILADGKIKVEHPEDDENPTTLAVESGARLVLRDVDIDTTWSAIFPAGNASEVVIENSTIKSSVMALATNRVESASIHIVISDSELISPNNTAVLVNTGSDTHIFNSTITGEVHAVIIRAGYVEIDNTTLITTTTEPGIFAYDNFAKGYDFKGWWHSGNTIPASTLVLGDYHQTNAFSGNVIAELTNVKLQSASSTAVPEVLLAASHSTKKVTLTYDDASIVGTVKVYGETWNGTDDNVGVTFSHNGTITVNGAAKMFYGIPAGVGTFATGEYSASELDVDYNTVPTYDYNATVRAQIESKWNVTFTDAEWATVSFQFSSGTANDLKNIYYTKDGAQVHYGCDASGDYKKARFVLTDVPHIALLNTQSVSVLKQQGYVQNCLDEFTAYCQNAGITVTSSTKIVVGSNNAIIGVK